MLGSAVVSSAAFGLWPQVSVNVMRSTQWFVNKESKPVGATPTGSDRASGSLPAPAAYSAEGRLRLGETVALPGTIESFRLRKSGASDRT